MDESTSIYFVSHCFFSPRIVGFDFVQTGKRSEQRFRVILGDPNVVTSGFCAEYICARAGRSPFSHLGMVQKFQAIMNPDYTIVFASLVSALADYFTLFFSVLFFQVAKWEGMRTGIFLFERDVNPSPPLPPPLSSPPLSDSRSTNVCGAILLHLSVCRIDQVFNWINASVSKNLM